MNKLFLISIPTTFLALLLVSYSAFARPNTSSCPAGNTISKTFPSGAAWDMCWEVRNEEGVVLSDVHYKAAGNTRKRVLAEAGLSQIYTEYDDASTPEFVVTESGLGGNNLQTLTSAMCQGGQLRQNAGRSVLCEATRSNGYIYRYRNNTRRQGDRLEVYSVSKAGSREFIVHWNFLENGIIEPKVGLTGEFTKTTSSASSGWQVTADNILATSFTDHYFWRLDFDLASGNENDIVEQIQSVPSSDRLTKTKQTQTVSTETASSFKPSDKMFWRVKDQSETNNFGQAISYEMVMLNYAQQSKGNSSFPWLKNDIFITQYDSCERFAVQNSNAGCGENVTEFVNAQNINAEDIVVWYRLAHHTLPRDEDFSPAPVRWSSFTLLPRDWTSSNSL